MYSFGLWFVFVWLKLSVHVSHVRFVFPAQLNWICRDALFWSSYICIACMNRVCLESCDRKRCKVESLNLVFNLCRYPSAYEQKQPTGMKPSSPVTPPCSTPVSPLHHGSPTAAPTPKPDRTYTHIPTSQPLPDNAYTMDHRYWDLKGCSTFEFPPLIRRILGGRSLQTAAFPTSWCHMVVAWF